MSEEDAMTAAELEQPRPETGLINVETGELLPATVENAAAVLIAARNVKQHVNDVVAETTAYLVAEAERQGTRTLHGDQETVVVAGGPGTEVDAHDLAELLREAGCPEQRIEAAITTEISYKVNRSVLRQLVVNPDYAAAVELATRPVQKPWRASVKARRTE
jgi:hypothetical protein